MARIEIPRIIQNKNITNLSELAIYTQSLTNAFSEYMAQLGMEFMRDYIIERVYMDNALSGGSSPTSYDRTGDFFNAITITQSSKGNWSVGIDGRKINVSPADEGTSDWGQHAGIHGEAVAGAMAEFIDQGNDSTIYSYQGIEYVKATEDYLNNIYKTEWQKFKSKNNI